MNNLRILLYVVVLSLAACHPEGTNVKQGLDKAAQLMGQDPDTASIILENIQINQMNEAQLAEYNLLCTQLNEDKNIAHTSDKQIRQAVSYFDQHGNELQKSKAYFYLACVESDLDQKKEAETHFKEAIKLAALTEKYDYVAKVCRRCSLYYQKYGHFDEALEMERKAYASQLMLNDQTGDTKIILSSALGVFGVMSLLLGLLWKKNKFVYSQLTTFKDEMLRKEAESDKLMLQCNYLEEKYQSLQQHIYESSPVVSKVRQIKERSVSPSKVVSFSEKDWSELLRLQEGVYGLVSKLKEISPACLLCRSNETDCRNSYPKNIQNKNGETYACKFQRITGRLHQIIVVRICPELPDKKFCFSTPYRNGMSVSVRLKMPVLYHCSITLQTKKLQNYELLII